MKKLIDSTSIDEKSTKCVFRSHVVFIFPNMSATSGPDPPIMVFDHPFLDPRPTMDPWKFITLCKKLRRFRKSQYREV